jgi:hypothetical protein
MVDLEEAIVRGERPAVPESCPPDYTMLIEYASVRMRVNGVFFFMSYGLLFVL